MYVVIHEDVNSSNRIGILLQCCQQTPVKFPLGLSCWLQIRTIVTILLNWTLCASSRRTFSKGKLHSRFSYAQLHSFIYPHQNIINVHITDTTHWDPSLVRDLLHIFRSRRCVNARQFVAMVTQNCVFLERSLTVTKIFNICKRTCLLARRLDRTEGIQEYSSILYKILVQKVQIAYD
jgi:hypothetical protein